MPALQIIPAGSARPRPRRLPSLTTLRSTTAPDACPAGTMPSPPSRAQAVRAHAHARGRGGPGLAGPRPVGVGGADDEDAAAAHVLDPVAVDQEVVEVRGLGPEHVHLDSAAAARVLGEVALHVVDAQAADRHVAHHAGGGHHVHAPAARLGGAAVAHVERAEHHVAHVLQEHGVLARACDVRGGRRGRRRRSRSRPVRAGAARGERARAGGAAPQQQPGPGPQRHRARARERVERVCAGAVPRPRCASSPRGDAAAGGRRPGRCASRPSAMHQAGSQRPSRGCPRSRCPAGPSRARGRARRGGRAGAGPGGCRATSRCTRGTRRARG